MEETTEEVHDIVLFDNNAEHIYMCDQRYEHDDPKG